MIYSSQAELAGFLMGLGFRLLEGCSRIEENAYIVGAGVSGNVAVLSDEAAAVAQALCKKLEDARSRFPRKRLFIRSLATYTLALDEYDRFWIAAERIDLSPEDFIEVTRLPRPAQLS